MAATFPMSPDTDKKKFWATDCSNNNNQFDYITSKDSGDVWIIRRVEKESYEKTKNGGISNNVLGDKIIDSDEGEDDYDTRDKTKDNEDYLKRTPFQKKLYHFFEEPRSVGARFFSVFSALCTVGAVALVCINSLPKYELSDRPLLLPLRLLFSMTFTVEYLGRFFASVNKKKFLFGIMSILDLIAIIPFFIQLAIPRQENATYSLRVLQLVRIVRLSDFIRHSVGFKAAMRVVRRSSNQILFMSFWYFTIIILSSSLMFLTERGEFDPETKVWMRKNPNGHMEVSPFQSIIHSFYWSVVTLTTTGYGDDIPYTIWGRIVTGIAITCGLLFLVIPSSIIGSNLSVEWTRAHRLAKLKETRQLAEAPKNPANIALWQIKYLQRRNRELLEAIAEVQDVLADVNPRKYREIQIEHVTALQKIVELEAELDRWKQMVCKSEYQQRLQPQQPQQQQQQRYNTDIEKIKLDTPPKEAVNELYTSSFPGLLTDADVVSDGDYQSKNEMEISVIETATAAATMPTTPTTPMTMTDDTRKKKTNAAIITTTTNTLNPFKMFRRSSKRNVPANTAVSSSFDTHSTEPSITAPESAYVHTYKDDYDHPQSVMTAQVNASVRLTRNDLIRSATLPCGECPKYTDKNVLSSKESGLMDLFRQRINASSLRVNKASGVTNEKNGNNVTVADIQSKKDNFLNRRAVDDCIISKADIGTSGDNDGDGEAASIEIVVERNDDGKTEGSREGDGL